MTLKTAPIALAVVASLAAGSPALAAPDSVGFAIYFDADVRDAAECGMHVENGEIWFDPRVANPAMSCPDMFAWKLFVDVTRQEWWSNWASDQHTWPKEPLRLCEPGQAGPDCCLPGAADNPGYSDPGTDPDYAYSMHCPYFPGDHDALAGGPRRLGMPIGAHAITLGAGGIAANLTTPLSRPGEPEPGRVIRQEVGEITVRNQAMFDYIFENNLYNQAGIAAVFDRNSANLAANAPYQATNPSGNLSRIDLPTSAIMIKSDWLYHEFARDMGLVDDPDAPYVKKDMVTTIGDKEYRGEHWMMAFHISTKDLPQWVWVTFEHVNNPGRCDFIGCNDSYGYQSDDPRPSPGDTVANFTAPHVRSDGLGNASDIFNLGLRYTSGPISPGLAEIFEGMQIGIAGNGNEPAPTDQAWLSYRLKGSQVNFTNTMGRSTRLGNSVTEGGFMGTSSCVSCHARASVAATGKSDAPIEPALGVMIYDVLNEVGYAQSISGVPQKDWYHGSGFKPALRALQTDFMWGMPFFAKPLSAPK